MPTILDTLNIPILQQAQGISLKAICENKKDFRKSKYVYVKSEFCESIRSSKYKLIYHNVGDQYEFYDLKTDPQEATNIYGQKSDILNTMHQDYILWKNNLVSYADKTNDFPLEIDEKTRERVRKFGYW